MPKASVKRFIERDKETLIKFVLDIEKYPDFIPFCIDSKVYEKKDDQIHVTNIDGPLNYLENNWKFIEKNNFTEVQFDVDFEIKNKFLNFIMSKSFKYGLDKIADAFQKRAENL